MNITSKDLEKAMREAKRGTGNTVRLHNYQVRVLLHFARIGLRIEQSNAKQREVISALKHAQTNGVFND